MYTVDEIRDFVAKQTGVNRTEITLESRLREDLGVEGDDFFDLEHAFAEQFKVDMSTYRWYFHHGEEGGANLGAIFFAPPDARVGQIPVTISLLLDAANSGRWSLEYPPHQIPGRRYDLLVNWVIMVFVVLAALLGILHHFKLF